VTGACHRGISLSGVGRSAFGSRLQVPEADGRDPRPESIFLPQPLSLPLPL